MILGEKKRGKDFRLFFSIYLRSLTVLGNLTEKKSIFFRQISRQSCENDFHSSTISVDPLELKLFLKNCHVTKSSLSHTSSHICKYLNRSKYRILIWASTQLKCALNLHLICLRKWLIGHLIWS